MSQISQIDLASAAALGANATSYTGAALNSDTFAALLAAQLNGSLLRLASASTEDTGLMSGGTSDLVNLFMTGAVLNQLNSTQDSVDQTSTDEKSSFALESTDSQEHRGLTITRVYSPDVPSALEATEPAYTQAHQDSAISALTRLGHPYSQAKRGTGNYVDCSYLTQWAYAQNGISLPGTAAEQARYCQQNGFEVSSSNLKTGDLVFWQKPGCTCGRYNEIHHVGIYIGDGRVIEASSSRGEVVVNDLWDGDGWKLAFCARPS